MMMSESLSKFLCNGKIENLSSVIKEFSQFYKNYENKSSNVSLDESYLIIFLFLNRVFSEEVTGCQNIPIAENWQRGKVGGWMKEIAGVKSLQFKTQTIESPSISGFSTGLLQREYGLSMEAIQLLSLFSAHPNADNSLLKLIGGFHRYHEVDLSIFPKKIQWKYLSRPEYECLQTPNHLLYDEWYAGFRYDQVRDGYSEPIMSVDLLSYYFICFFRYPAIENAFLQYSYGNPGNPNSERASLEYFFSSGNYSRAKKLLSNDSEISLIKILSVYGCSGWFKGNPYLALLNHYLEHFLPVVLPKEDQPIIQSHYLAQDRIGNLFLRLLIDIWIDTIGIIRCPSDRSLPHIAQHDPNLSSIRLSDFYNCSRVYLFDSSSSTFPTRHTFQCIYIVVVHLMAEASPHNPMPYALSMLQQPIFDLLRGIFASKVVEKSLFFLVARLWHLWITPWKPHSKTRQSSGSTKSGSNLVKDAIKVVSDATGTDLQRKDYSDVWRPYIAGNLHFYTTMLVIFLRGISQRKLSENINGLYALESTLTIYSNPLVKAIDSLSVGYLAQLSRTTHIDFTQYITSSVEKSIREGFMNNSISPLSSLEFDFIVQQVVNSFFEAHSLKHRNLFPFIQDASTAIVHYRKELNEDGIEIIRKLITLAEAPKGFEESFISGLVGKVLLMFGIDESRGDRFSRLKEMETKLRKLLLISTVIEPIATGYISNRGDVMKRPLLSNEIGWIARLMVLISSWINSYYNLPIDKSSVTLTWTEVLSKSSIGFSAYFSAIRSAFRINLRLFANISTLCIMSWLCIFTIYKIANLSEIWLAVFTGFSSLPFLLTTMQDTIEVGPLESHKLETSQLDIAKHGTLTKEGREQLLAGKRFCDKNSISFRGDVMLKPLRSDEFGLLVKYLVWISKKFNETHGLPADDNSVYMNWIDLLSKVPFSFQSYSNVIKSSFRMNLRFLAHVRVLCFLSFVIVIGLYQMNIISWTSTSVISGLLLSLFWYGRFTGVLPWQYY